MLTIRKTDAFAKWLTNLRDLDAKARVEIQIVRLELGNPGDVRSVSGGVLELRVHYGPGYRVYFIRRGRELVILLGGGDKSTRVKDILNAKALADQLSGEHDGG
jgi:putative addiction module killer protein